MTTTVRLAVRYHECIILALRYHECIILALRYHECIMVNHILTLAWAYICSVVSVAYNPHRHGHCIMFHWLGL